ncbi:septum site-determining protein MinC [Desulfonema ishimotonii]|uniref:Probable septum site-determining protein MinC n=1 Tax=Desulfonema ishimotonii TaxID=45657 RepID=A0A401FVF1_9BACT|nr:septum site-determining protein MinC [Desulfonema ishimotonii]GBC60946.1 septum site-determining protein MinC [Desulfonema ishimotonii]
MTDQDKTPVRLRGMGNSLCVTLNPDEPFEYLKEETEKLFRELKHLAVNARVMIDVGKPDGHEELIEKLGEFLKENFGVGAVSRPPKKKHSDCQPPDREWMRERDMKQSWQNYQTDVLMLTGRVRSGQKITARKHLLILGDVNPGAEVMAGGDILIMGTLLGTAIAGQPDNDNTIVLALDFRPTQVQIGSYVAAGLPSSPGEIAEFAHVENGTIVVENYLEANPFGRLPWPQVR